MTEDAVRIDKWLFFARFCKSRSLAARMCEDGLVLVDGNKARRAHHAVRVGATIAIELGRSIRTVRVTALGERRGPAPEARGLYEDLGTAPRASDWD